MIATLSGHISERLPDVIILEVSGVGYEVFTTVEEGQSLAAGTEIRLYIYDHIREDIHNLYGFKTLATKQLFVQLLGVSGVGPKLAMQILSSGESRLRQAIAAGNPDLLKGVSGVGTKTAERVIVDLKGKLSAGVGGIAPVTDDAYQALVALGYSPTEATEAVNRLPKGVTEPSERVKLALKQIQH
jgi:Holliday junction DNA helicase RuvA